MQNCLVDYLVYLQIVPTRLLQPPVGVDAHVTDRPDEVFGLRVVHVLAGRVPVALGQPEVDHVDVAAVGEPENAVLRVCDMGDMGGLIGLIPEVDPDTQGDCHNHP